MKKVIVCLLIFAGFSPGSVTAADILFIANKNTPDMELTRKEIQKIFLGKQKQWTDYSKVRPALAMNSEIRKPFIKQYLHKNASQFVMYWRRMVFSGRGKPPRSFENEAEVLAYVGETDGTIACISSQSIPKDGSLEVKIIKIR